MSRRTLAQPTVSLFPFLAVLVCTLGALILLLLVLTQKIRQQAVARELAERITTVPATPASEEPVAAAVPAEVAADPAPDERRSALAAARREEQRRAWEAQLEADRQRRDQQNAAINRRQQALQAASEAFESLKSQAARLRARLDAMRDAARASARDEERLTEQSERLEAKIAETRREIDLARRQQAHRKNEFALIPYDGTLGTLRRPIYIECTEKGFRFLPEGESLSAADLEGFSDQFNPLLSGAQALVRFWSEIRQKSGQREPEPYVLLVVRPSGSVAYYLARKLLASLSVHFGYELVEEDARLSMPEADPLARAVLRDALDVTLAARARLEKPPGGLAARGATAIRGDELYGQAEGDQEFNSGAQQHDRRTAPHNGQTSTERRRASRGGSVPDERSLPAAVDSGPGPRPGSSRNASKAPRAGRFGSALAQQKARPATLGGLPRETPDANDQREAGPLTSANPSIARNDAAEDSEIPRLDLLELPGESTEPAQPGGQKAHRSDRPIERGGPSAFPQAGRESSIGRGAALTDRGGGGAHPGIKRRWGKSRARATIGLERKLEIRVCGDRALIGSADAAVDISPGEKPEELESRLVSAIERSAIEWGEPPANFYWIPSIRFVVDPGANANYERIRGLTRRYGLTSTVEYTTDAEGPSEGARQ